MDAGRRVVMRIQQGEGCYKACVEYQCVMRETRRKREEAETERKNENTDVLYSLLLLGSLLSGLGNYRRVM